MLFFFSVMAVIALLFSLLFLIPLLIARLLFSFFFLIIALPTAAVVAYHYLGGAALIQELIHQQQQAQQVQVKIAELGNSPAAVIKALNANLQENPNDAQGWYLLGKLYLDQQDYANAVTSLVKANALEANKTEIMTTYAQALFFANNRSLSPRITQLLNAVLKLESNNVDALNLFAIGAYNAKEYSVAIHYWQQVLVLLPQDSNEQKLVIEMMDKAQSLEKNPH